MKHVVISPISTDTYFGIGRMDLFALDVITMLGHRRNIIGPGSLEYEAVYLFTALFAYQPG